MCSPFIYWPAPAVVASVPGSSSSSGSSANLSNQPVARNYWSCSRLLLPLLFLAWLAKDCTAITSITTTIHSSSNINSSNMSSNMSTRQLVKPAFPSTAARCTCGEFHAAVFIVYLFFMFTATAKRLRLYSEERQSESYLVYNIRTCPRT